MKPAFVCLVIALAGLAGLAGCGGQQTADPYVQDVDAWHAGRIERLQAEDGWLTLVGLHPLREGASTVGTAADCDVRLETVAPALVGVLDLAAGGVTFTPDATVTVEADGAALDGPITVVTDADGSPTVMRVGTVSFLVVARGDRHFLRVKDSASPVRRDFQGIDRFPVQAAWRVTARLDSDGMPTTVPIENVLGQIDQEPSPGVLVFEIDGRRHRLIPVGEPGEPLFIVFGDQTNGRQTYGGGRFLSTEAPDADGNVVLDFNRATNPPCAFTAYATCPMPPRENVLPVAVTAGEKAWGEHH